MSVACGDGGAQEAAVRDGSSGASLQPSMPSWPSPALPLVGKVLPRAGLKYAISLPPG